MHPWQERVLRGALGERKDGKWSASRVGLVVPRQNGKNAILEARELAGLFLFGEELITHTAHQFRTSKNSMTSLMNRMKSCPDLMKLVEGYEGPDQSIRDIDGFKVGNNPGIYLRNGRSIQYATRSGDAGRGFSGDVVIYDEAYALTAAEMGALKPTMAAKSMHGNPQEWYTSSAGKVTSEYLLSLRDQGKAAEAERLAYFEWSADDDAEIGDVDSWYEANPSLGILITEEFVREELEDLGKTADGEEEFRRERQGIWSKVEGEVVFPNWHACADEVMVQARVNGELIDQSFTTVTFAVDIPPDRSSASIVACGTRPDNTFFVEVVDRRDGTEWVAETIRAMVERQAAKGSRAGVFALGSGAAQALVEEFRRHRVRVVFVGDREYAAACGTLFDLTEQSLVAHSSQPELNAAVDAAKKKFLGDNLWKLTRQSTVSDISPLVATVLAALGAQKRRPTEKKPRRRGSVFA
ncbi:hypothetical protein DFO66_103376 [Brevibacterium sanguinis]|uniref:Phage terminase large subunit-like protein n=3 Tax=Brevibacteriaceae TaxID=85019 RepID=A0A366ILI6_9MICO|nr:hypothetical protein DFO66_103376 [Brevibacterium sanguinis]RBP73078.1 hypothetical protein DFO65_103376 [Brevibacterium celere]